MRHLAIGSAFFVACVALLLAAGCTSSKGGLTGSTQAPPVDAQTLPAGHPTVPAGGSQDLPVEALLAETDLGADWVEMPHQESPMAPQDSYFCGKKIGALPWTLVARFSNDATGSVVIEIVSKLSDTAAATASMKQERDATAGCSEWSSTADMKAAWHIESVSALDIGDEAVAEKSSTQFGDPPQTGIDYAFLVRKGDVIIRLEESVAGGLASDEPAGFARSAYAKLVKATSGASPTGTP